jgi:TRAP-type mannitol/chloroaromatic compound transport system substrate-binding protein
VVNVGFDGKLIRMLSVIPFEIPAGPLDVSLDRDEMSEQEWTPKNRSSC